MKIKQFNLAEFNDDSNISSILDVNFDVKEGINILTFNINNTVNINIDSMQLSDLIIYKCSEYDNIYTLAQKYYSNYRLWWVIAKCNKIIDPTKQLQADQILFILPPNTVKNIISTLKNI